MGNVAANRVEPEFVVGAPAGGPALAPLASSASTTSVGLTPATYPTLSQPSSSAPSRSASTVRVASVGTLVRPSEREMAMANANNGTASAGPSPARPKATMVKLKSAAVLTSWSGSVRKGDLTKLMNVYREHGGDIVDQPLVTEQKSNMNALHFASWQGDLPFVKSLVEVCGADVAVKAARGLTALYLACDKGHDLVVQYLLFSANADVNACIDVRFVLRCTYLQQSHTFAHQSGESPLFIACVRGHANVVHQLLLHPQIRVNDAKVGPKLTPLSMACQSGNVQIVNKLLAAGANPCLATSTGVTPLMVAIQNQREDVVEFMIHHAAVKPSIAMQNQAGETALHMAAAFDNCYVVQALVEMFPEMMEAVTKSGCTAVHVACGARSYSTVKWILARDPHLATRPSSSGDTPLHWVCRGGNLAIVQLLVDKYRVPIDIPNSSGSLPIDVANRNKHPAVVNFLRGHGCPSPDISKRGSAQSLASRGSAGQAPDMVESFDDATGGDRVRDLRRNNRSGESREEHHDIAPHVDTWLDEDENVSGILTSPILHTPDPVQPTSLDEDDIAEAEAMLAAPLGRTSPCPSSGTGSPVPTTPTHVLRKTMSERPSDHKFVGPGTVSVSPPRRTTSSSSPEPQPQPRGAGRAQQ